MPYRKIPLSKGEIYHIFTKSIAGYKIFDSNSAFQRGLETIAFYTIERSCRFSLFLRRKAWLFSKADSKLPSKRIVRILAYCLMPTHIHLILQQLEDEGISRYLNLILKSYSKYFNEKHKRKGPLWEGRFKNVLVDTDEQFFHLTRYIHLNPVSSFLTEDPKNWVFSSYREYIGLVDENKKLCDFSRYLDMDYFSYEKFVKDRIDYQRDLSQIKHLILE